MREAFVWLGLMMLVIMLNVGRGGEESRRWPRGGREAGFDIEDTIPKQNYLSLSPAIKALNGFGTEWLFEFLV